MKYQAIIKTTTNGFISRTRWYPSVQAAHEAGWRLAKKHGVESFAIVRVYDQDNYCHI
jgi:hypothetical protein